ncbi:hypothetical protein SLS60_011037 [Paraconiothyrium brasiliense]|uniref:DSBA-like thioredoxin domain-containing protein n=1 Tax=Paraconiothyrium brasiliense TaxID=300254 RepID=A0ABR3QKE1_9PLEO
MEKYVTYMKTLFEAEDVDWTPYGVIANTLHAHRVVHVVQERHGPGVALRLVVSLYEAYFTRGEHPSSVETLRSACAAAGLNENEAGRLVEDDCDEGMVDVKGVIREQVGNGVDSVPYVVFEGRRRDFTLVGAKEVGEYVKTMEQVAKEV